MREQDQQLRLFCVLLADVLKLMKARVYFFLWSHDQKARVVGDIQESFTSQGQQITEGK